MHSGKHSYGFRASLGHPGQLSCHTVVRQYTLLRIEGKRDWMIEATSAYAAVNPLLLMVAKLSVGHLFVFIGASSSALVLT
jgi:hypothetical protein